MPLLAFQAYTKRVHDVGQVWQLKKVCMVECKKWGYPTSAFNSSLDGSVQKEECLAQSIARTLNMLVRIENK